MTMRIVKKRSGIGFLAVILLAPAVWGQPKSPPFSVSATLWDEGLGSQRAVIDVQKPADAVCIRFFWRRHDPSPEAKRFIILDAFGGVPVRNVRRIRVEREACELIFGPVVRPGRFFFYYLPFAVMRGSGNYGKDYLPPEPSPDPSWLASCPPPAKCARGEVKEIQARTPFDSFFPMEIIPTLREKRAFLATRPAEYILFPEDRSFPIRMDDEIPAKWLKMKSPGDFSGEACINEYYPFQVGIFARKDLRNVKVRFSDLKSSDGAVIPASAMTCFNTDGIAPDGRPFAKRVDVKNGMVQPLWIGVDIGQRIRPGTFAGAVTVSPQNAPAQTVHVRIRIIDKRLVDRGDGEPWRHSRLRWLNSTLGVDDDAVPPYPPIRVSGENRFAVLGRDMEVSESRLPSSIISWGTEILQAPVRFDILTGSGRMKFDPFQNVSRTIAAGRFSADFITQNRDLWLSLSTSLEADGYIRYRYTIQALRDLDIADIRLEIPFKADAARYMMGMGFAGGFVPEKYETAWAGPYDSFWVGNTYGGLLCELRGASYTGPLLNLYKPEYPASWSNGGKGGFSVRKEGDTVLAVAYGGSRKIAAGAGIDFEFALLITPVKKIDTKKQFTERYYHNGINPWPSEEEAAAGVRIINVHHANRYNPYINYPFLAQKELRFFVDTWHKRGMKVKTYYTIRELTTHLPELWALRSLGDEVLAGGTGGGYPWLREHLVRGYAPQWYHHFDDDPSLGVDAAVRTAAGSSRWHNYYVEGLAWLVRNMDIDGLYLDDVAFDRSMLKRMRKVMERIKPGCLIDLHSDTGLSKGPAVQYADFFPYIDKLWFGEGFLYDEMSPENWLVEVSGIPFGLMGDMLQGGGNGWRGMVYGMALRYPWLTDGVVCDPRAIWKAWDDFGIADAKMIGYWDNHPVVSASDPRIRATAYVKSGKTLISLASWAPSRCDVRLDIDWHALGLDPAKAKITAPAIPGFQPAREFAVHEPIPVEPKRGWLLWIEY
jgi:hypothetical protein